MIARADAIRVLHVVGTLGLGGTEKAMRLFVTGLGRRRFLPAVFATDDGPRRAELEAAGIPLFIGGDLFAVLGRFRPHIVHLHRAGWADRAGMRPILLHRGARPLPKIVETNVFGRLDTSPDETAIDVHLFISRFCLERYGRMPGVVLSPKRHRVLYYPVDTRFFAERCPPLSVRDCGPVVGRLSRADRGKWSPLAWEMLPFVVRRVPEVRFRVVGCVDEAVAAFGRLGVGGCVECVPPLVGETPLADFLNTLRVLAHANDTGESFGLAIAEAMAAGLPVVTHPSVGERDNAQVELVEDGATGLVAATPESYGTAVAWLLTHPEEAAAMGERGREKAARLFDVQTIVSQLEKIYLELLTESDLSATGMK